jgi:hypothetical protein
MNWKAVKNIPDSHRFALEWVERDREIWPQSA